MPVETFAEIHDGEGNHYLIFIDEIFSRERLRDEALKGIARDLQALEPRDKVAIVAMDSDQFEILCAWTHPGPELESLLRRMIRHPGSLAGSGLRLKSADPAAERLRRAYQALLDRLYAEEAWRRGAVDDARVELASHEKALSAAAASLGAFTGVPGRKLMLLLSGGWEIAAPPAQERSDAPAAPDGTDAAPATQATPSLLAPLVDTANLLGFTVYPVFLTPREQSGSLQVADGTKEGTLRFTAVETGGDVLRQEGNRHLEKVAIDARLYYRLGFSFLGDGRRRNVQVQVRRPGLRTRSLSSFVPLSPPARASLQANTALLEGAVKGAAPLVVEAGKLDRNANGTAEVVLTVGLPLDQITLLQETGRQTGELELRIAVTADDGDRLVIPAIRLRIVHEEESPPPPFRRYETTFRSRYKAQRIQVVLIDLLGGKFFVGQARSEPHKDSLLREMKREKAGSRRRGNYLVEDLGKAASFAERV